MSPHLHRRPPLRKHLPPRRTLLLLPPHHPKTRSPPVPRPKIQLRPTFTRRPQRHPGLHRHHPPENSQQRPRLQKSRPAPLRPPDRQPKPPQTATSRPRNPRTDPRDHHRPGTRHPRPTNRNRGRKELRRQTPRRTNQTRSPAPNPGSRTNQPKAHSPKLTAPLQPALVFSHPQFTTQVRT